MFFSIKAWSAIIEDFAMPFELDEKLDQGINKYFRFNTVKEIMEELEDNKIYDSFAELCLDAITQRSLIASQVT